MAFSPSQGAVGGPAAGHQPQPQETLFLDHDLVQAAAVQGDSEIGFDLRQHVPGPVGTADLLVAGDQDTEGQVGLIAPRGAQALQLAPQQDQGQGHGVLVIDAAPAVEAAVFFPGLEDRLGAVDHVDVGHQQHRGVVPLGRDQDRGDAGDLEAPEADAVGGQEGLHEIGAADDLGRVGVHRSEADKFPGEAQKFLHDVDIPIKSCG